MRNPPGAPIKDTTLNYTGQQLDGTNLLYYHARYYDPVLSRFVSPDSIVPGVEDGKGGAADSIGAVQNHKLTVDFHEPGFISSVQKEHDLVLEKGFWFQLKEEDREKVKDPWGPLNTSALNRYAYVMNNPLRYTDPTGHRAPVLLLLGGALLGVGSGVALDVGIDYATAADKANFDWADSAGASLQDPWTYLGIVPIGKLAKLGKVARLGQVVQVGGKSLKVVNKVTVLGYRRHTRFYYGKGDLNVLNPDVSVTWDENKAWLDEAIERGDAFILASEVDYSAKHFLGSYYRKEIEYLQSRGYVFDRARNLIHKP